MPKLRIRQTLIRLLHRKPAPARFSAPKVALPLLFHPPQPLAHVMVNKNEDGPRSGFVL